MGIRWEEVSVIDQLFGMIREVLLDSDDLLAPQYRNKHRRSFSTGHCYVASEAYYHLAGRKEALKIFYMKWEGEPHWFLKDEEENVIDLTWDQFRVVPNYWAGKRKHFLTREPSKRARVLIQRVEAKL
jgi:hypothetical protein